MPLTREQVVHIATLCRIGMTEEDLERFARQLSHILEQFEVLKQVDTAQVPPTAQSIELSSVFKDDKPRPSLPREEVLRNAPLREEEYLRVKAVLEE